MRQHALSVLGKRAESDDRQRGRPGARCSDIVQTPTAVGILPLGQPNRAPETASLAGLLTQRL